MSANRGIYVAPFDELVDPRVLAELATWAEARGLERVLPLGPRRASRARAGRGRRLGGSECGRIRHDSCGSGRWSRRCRVGESTSWRARGSRWTASARGDSRLASVSASRTTKTSPSEKCSALASARATSRPRPRQIERILGWRISSRSRCSSSDPGVGGGGLAQSAAAAAHRTLGRLVPEESARASSVRAARDEVRACAPTAATRSSSLWRLRPATIAAHGRPPAQPGFSPALGPSQAKPSCEK